MFGSVEAGFSDGSSLSSLSLPRAIAENCTDSNAANATRQAGLASAALEPGCAASMWLLDQYISNGLNLVCCWPALVGRLPPRSFKAPIFIRFALRGQLIEIDRAPGAVLDGEMF